MSLRKIAFTTCLMLPVACLAAGYASAGLWVGCGLAALTGLGWLAARRNPGSGLAGMCLLLSVGLAGGGLFSAGLAPGWMLCGAALALAAWDLVLLDQAPGELQPDAQSERHARAHLRALGLAVGGGLAVGLLGGRLNMRIPFAALLVGVVLVCFAFEGAWSTLKKRRRRLP